MSAGSHGDRESYSSSARTVDVLLVASKVHRLEAADLLLALGGSRASSDGGGAHQARGGGKGALLDTGRGDLAGQWAAQGLGEGSRGHRDVSADWDKGRETDGRAELRGFRVT